jgi:TonB-linked SusC/RagA family outer membrane protein
MKKNHVKACLLTILYTLLGYSAPNFIQTKQQLAQNKILISGTVTDELGVLPEVTIFIKGNLEGTVADFDGHYSIDALPQDTLVFSYVGYTPVEIRIGSQKVIDVQLLHEVTALLEVEVNAGYYTVKEREQTGNITKVTAAEIALQPLVSPLETLQGRMAGVVVNKPTGVAGSAPVIQIRGQNSLRSDGNYPLYIIDGVPINSAPISGSGLLALGMDPLSTLGLSQIESIEILKDADATAIYGSRGANGVVLVTTKKGKAGKTKMEVQLYTGLGQLSNTIDVLHTDQYIEMRTEALQNDGVVPSLSNAPDLVAWDSSRDVNWQEELMGETVYTTNTQLSFSGGSRQTSFVLGGAFYKETTVFPGDFGYQKTNGFINLGHHSKDQKFHLNFSTTYGVDANDLFYGGEIPQTTVMLAPNAPELYTSEGDLNWEDSTWTNPLSHMRRKQNIDSYTLMANASISYSFFKGFQLKTNLGFTRLNSETLRIDPLSAYNPTIWQYVTNSSSRDVTTRQSYTLEPQLLFSQKREKLGLDAVVGMTLQDSENTHLVGSSDGYAEENLIGNLAMAENVYVSVDEKTPYKYQAVFGRIGLNWEGKYLLNLTGRRDGSSRFAPKNRFANFGAVGVAWIFSEAKFLKQHLPLVSFGKLRGSYGTTGSDQIADYGYYNSYEATIDGGLYPSQLGSPTYSWEVNKKLELAMSLGFFKDRILVNASWYRNRSSNQLVGYYLPAITGFTSIQANQNATVENRGWELEFTSQTIKTNDFEWRTSFNLSLPKNELIDFPNIAQSSYANTYQVGTSLNSTRLYESLGVNPETGFYEVKDENEDGSFSIDDKIITKDMNRQYYGGFQNTFDWGNFHFDFLLEYVKQLGRNHLVSFETAPGRLGFIGGNQSPVVLERWQNPGDITDVQQFSSYNSYTPYSRIAQSDLSIIDSSYLRLKTASLSYQLPLRKVSDAFIQQCRIFFHGQNLWTGTKDKGWNPDNNSGSLATLPPLRTFTLGVQLTL